MVGMARFERATPASRTQCPTRLGHIPTSVLVYIIFTQMSIKKLRMSEYTLKWSRGLSEAKIHDIRNMEVIVTQEESAK